MREAQQGMGTCLCAHSHMHTVHLMRILLYVLTTPSVLGNSN